MADAGVIINAKLDSENLTQQIDELVNSVTKKFNDMATNIQESVDKVKTSIRSIKDTARSNVSQIKQAFDQLGTTFDNFARAMQRAAAAASGLGGAGGRGGAGGTGGAPTPSGNLGNDTIGELKQQIKEWEKLRDQISKYDQDLQVANDIIHRLKQEVAELTKSTQKLNQEQAKSARSKEQKRVSAATSMPTTTINEAERKLRRLEGTLQRLHHTRVLDEAHINRVKNAITRTNEQLERLRAKAAIPTNMAGVMGMSERTLNDISLKMKAISELRNRLPVGSTDVARLNAEYARLSKLQSEVLGKNTALVESNNALGRAFNYIRNRLAFTLTIGAFTGFVRQLYEIRGQYELLERSLGVLLNSFSKGSQIFNELNQMAIKSPFTLIELGTAAKQLTAYNFKANEVVDTTRRLADISSALGVPMERLVYNLGQIRAQTVLTARDARDFANAGLAIVPELAKYYTELEGKVVSTADVFDRMKKKAVSYNDTMAVLYKLTDEGGKFFDFQAKQAGTLKVQLANLNLAWNNMLNDMGASNQKTLTAPVAALRSLFLNWKDINAIINSAVIGLGAYKAMQMVVNRTIGVANWQLQSMVIAEKKSTVARLEKIQATRALTAAETQELNATRISLRHRNLLTAADYELALIEKNLTQIQAMRLVALNKGNVALHQALVNMGLLTQAEVQQARALNVWNLAWERVKYSVNALGRSLMALMANPLTWFMTAATIVVEFVSTLNAASDAVKEFNQSIASSAKESSESLSKFLSDYQKTNQSMYKWEGIPFKMQSVDLSSSEAKKTWEAIKEEIIQSSAAGREFVSQLELISDVNDRIRAGFRYIEEIQQVHGALEEIKDDTIRMQQDWSKWWNLWAANDSLEENLKDYVNSLDKVKDKWGEISDAIEKYNTDTNFKGGGDVENYISDLSKLRANLAETAQDMVNYFAEKGFSPEQEREAFNKVADEMVQKMNLSTEQSLRFRMSLEESYSNERRKLYEKELGENYKSQYFNWIETFQTGQSLETEFLKWMGRNRRSEVQRMFGDMTAEEISHINWSEPKWAEWANKNASEFAKQYHLSFNELRGLVINANGWSVRIPVFFDFVNDQKSIYETLTEADQAADSSYQKYKRLQERLNQLRSQGKQKTKEYTDTEKEATDALKEYNEELAKGGKSKSAEAAASKRANAANKANAKARREQAKAESELQKSLKDELQIIDKVQNAYKKLTKAGVSREESLGLATSGFENSVNNINKVLKKYGIVQFDIKKFAGISNPREMLKMLEDQLNALKKSSKAKPVEIKEFEAQIDKIRVDAREYDMKKITDGLNNELGKIKEEYELAVELDANPELGDMFADMFGIDVDELPHTFGEAYDKANKVAIEKLKKLEKEVRGFDLMSTDLTKFAEKQGIEPDSNLIQELMKEQKTWRDMYKKNLVETEKFLDDYVKKYGNMSDKIAEIEADRLEKIKQLNEAYYTKQMQKMPEYTAKLDAINKGAEREKGTVKFDEFKNSRLYVAMFENLQYVSTATLTTIRQKLVELRDEMGTLSPEKLKQVVQQFEKIDDELRARSPFKGLIKNYKDYIKANGKAGKQAEKDLVVAQENYDKQMKIVTALKEQLVQEEKQEQKDLMRIAKLRILIQIENEKLKGLDEELEKAIKLNEQYNLMKKVFGEQWQSLGKLAQTVSTNLKSLGELRDYLKDAGVDFGDAFDGVVDSLQGVGEGMNQIVSSATSGDVFGVITGTVKTIFGIGDAIASIFGDGAARTRRINREIKSSQEEVRRLNMAYKDLERTVNKAMGSQEIAAQRALIANKKAELAEIERQMRLEKSKRSKDRDEDAIKQYEETAQGLKHEIEDLGDALVENLLGSNVKSAAEDFVDTWVNAWKQGETTLDAIQGKMDEVIQNLIKKAVASKVVGTLLQPFYNAVDQFASETSEGGVELTLNELRQLSEMANTLGININDALTALFANFENLGIVSKGGTNAELSALQQGITNISETTAEALEAYMNSVSQQVYYQSDILTQIRDILVNFGGDITIATNAQILFELQQSYQVQMSIQSILQGWSNASGLAVRVELAN